MKWPALLLFIPILAIVVGRATASGLSGIHRGVGWRVVSESFGEGEYFLVELSRPGMEPYFIGDNLKPWAFDTPEQAKTEAIRQIEEF